MSQPSVGLQLTNARQQLIETATFDRMQPLENPFTGRRLASFLCLHFLAFGAEIAGMTIFVITKDYFFFTFMLLPFLFSGLFCTHAAWQCDAPVLGSRFLPLKDRSLLFGLFLALPLGIGQGVIVILALEEYYARSNPDETTSANQASRQHRPAVNKFHCKAVNGLFEGVMSTAVLLYAYWSLGVPESHPITVMHCCYERTVLGILGMILFLSSGLGLMEMDYCTSRAIARRMRRSPCYEVTHWLFRTCEVTSRVNLYIAFMVGTRQYVWWWWVPLATDFFVTVLLVVFFSGAESSWFVRLLCSIPSAFANLFAFIDSPYKRRAARRLSRWIVTKNAFAMLLLPLLAYLATPNFEEEVGDDWAIHTAMIVVACSSIVMYWFLLWYVSSTSLNKYNMPDIFTACEQGSVTSVRMAMRDLTHSAAVCLNVNCFDIDGNTPLMLAASRGHARVCNLLLQEGARVDIKLYDDSRPWIKCLSLAARRRWTALHLAAWHGHYEATWVLLAGAGLLSAARSQLPNQGKSEDECEGEVQSHTGHTPFIPDLLAYTDSRGETPLHVAARAGNADVAGLLAAACPTWREVLAAGRRPIDLARKEDVQSAISQPNLASHMAPLRLGGARVPLLPLSQSANQDEAWPQVQLSIAKSSAGDQLIAPGLCSYIASSCGGALGRAFLIHGVRSADMPNRDMSFMTHISEASEEGGSFVNAAPPGLNWQISLLASPEIDDLEPADHLDQPILWWKGMFQSTQAAGETSPSSGTTSGKRFTMVPPESHLGQGSFGLVWRAKDRSTGRLYAVKNIMAPRRGSSSVAMRECEVADHVRLKPHPCVVQLFHVHNYSDAGLFVVVMEFCPGGDLLGNIRKQRTQTGKRTYKSPPKALHWIGQVFLGLEHLHLRMETLLRDLKPENVVLNSHGDAKLTDFGSGRFGVESPGAWTFGFPTGSPGYIAPEVLRQQIHDSAADLYSLGVLSWVMLTGGLIDKEDPLPPLGVMKFRGDFRAHFQDCHLLASCLNRPEANRARALDAIPRDFVKQLTAVNPSERMRHAKIRQHPLLQEVCLPPFDAGALQVQSWVESCRSVGPV